ncbi:hypothetical protein OAF09_00010 [bacterium]|nr:hypothetical protein [bacterium]
MYETSDDPEDPPIEAELVKPGLEDFSVEPIDGTTPQKGVISKAMQSRLAVMATLFCVTGALGLPLLWVNEKFSHTERIFWATVVTLYTFALIALVVWICWWSYQQVISL